MAVVTAIPNIGSIPQDTSNITVLSDGSLVFATQQESYPNYYLYLWRSTDKGATWYLHCKMKHSVQSFSFANLRLSANGMKVVVGTIIASTSVTVIGVDFSVVSSGADISNVDTSPPAGVWFKTLAGGGTSSTMFSIYYASDNRVYLDYLLFQNYDSDDDVYTFVCAVITYGSGSIDVTSNAIGTEAHGIIEYGGYVLFQGGGVGLRFPLGSNVGTSINCALPSYSTFLVHPSNGYLYAMSPTGTNQFRIYRTNNISGGMVTWTDISGTDVIFPQVMGAQMNPSGQISVYGWTNNFSTNPINRMIISDTGAVIQGNTVIQNGATNASPLSIRTNRYSLSASSTNKPNSVNAIVSPYNVGMVVYTYTETYNVAPNAPTVTSPTTGQNLNTRTPTITWTFSDPDAGDSQSNFWVEVVNEPHNAVLWNSGWIAGNVRSYTLPAGAITADGRYYLRIRVMDAAGVVNIANGTSLDPNYGGNGLITIDTVTPTYSNANVGTTPVNLGSGATKNVSVDIADNLSGAYIADAYYQRPDGTWTQYLSSVVNNGATRTMPVPITAEGAYKVHFYIRDNAGNNGAWPLELNFFIDRTAPTAPTQTNGTLYATTNGVSWSAFSDGANPSGLLSTTLYLQMYNGSTWNNVAGYPKSVTGLSSSLTGLTPGTQYRWGIVYMDNAGNQNALSYITFTTNFYAVSTTVNLAAAGALLNQKPRVRFTVTDANNATLTNFQIQISTVNTFSSMVLDATSGASAAGWGATSLSSSATNSYIPQSNIGTGTFYVRVRAHDGIEWGTWSTIVSFTISAVTWPTTIADTDTAISKRTTDSIRTAVNNVRQARGLATINWTDITINDWNSPSKTAIRAVHLTELRQAIGDIYIAQGLSVPIWTDTTITASSTQRKGKHWSELRSNLIGV